MPFHPGRIETLLGGAATEATAAACLTLAPAPAYAQGPTLLGSNGHESPPAFHGT
jgi:hypothetical protein